MKLTQYHKSLLIRGIIIVAALILLVFVIRKIKYSDFLTSLHKETSEEVTDSTEIIKQDSAAYSVPLDGYIFSNITDTQQIGKANTLNNSTDNMVYNVSYPSIGVSNLDEIISNDVHTEIESFESTYSGYAAPDEHSRASLNIDYQSYITGDSMVSVVFNIVTNLPLSNENIQSVHTHTFLLAQNDEITLDKVVGGKYTDFISSQVENYLSSDAVLKATMSDSPYKNNYSPSEENFGKYAFSNSGLTIYFDPETIAPAASGVISVTIPPNVILPYMLYDPFKQVPLTNSQLAAEGSAAVDNPDIAGETNKELYQATIDPSKPMVALTFDDGPRSLTTNKILDTLEKYGCHATFFVLGGRLANELDTAKRAHELGCDIGNHTYDHLKLSDLKSKQIKKQISKTNALLKKSIGAKADFVRTPYGETKKNVVKNVKSPIILWDIDTEDWHSLNAKKVYKAAIKNVSDGDIILMHDIYESTADAVKKIVPKLRKEGFQLVSISEMFKYKGIDPESKDYYYSIR